MASTRILARSALYVPGDQPGKLVKAMSLGADAVIVDLEDSVPSDRKGIARQAAADWLARADASRAGIWVRVNSGPTREADIRAVAAMPGVTGLCLAKTETVAQVEEAAGMLDAMASAAVLAPLLESAAAILAAPAIARAPRVVRLQIGEADLAAELGVEPGPDESELLWVRSQLVLASAAAQLDPPLGPVATNFRDLAALETSTRALRRLGYRGRACIHPAQVPVVNAAFTPTDEEVERARRVVERSATAGRAAVGDGHGGMIDEAVVRAARQVLALAGRMR